MEAMVEALAIIQQVAQQLAEKHCISYGEALLLLEDAIEMQ